MTSCCVEIRLMADDELDAVRALIRRVFDACVGPTYTQEGRRQFHAFLQPDALRRQQMENDLWIDVATIDNVIVGAIAVHHNTHIAMLFIDLDHQGEGLGKKLMSHTVSKCLKADPNLRALTVNAAPNAKIFYRHIGFVPVGPKNMIDGLCFTPMAKTLTDD